MRGEHSRCRPARVGRPADESNAGLPLTPLPQMVYLKTVGSDHTKTTPRRTPYKRSICSTCMGYIERPRVSILFRRFILAGTARFIQEGTPILQFRPLKA